MNEKECKCAGRIRVEKEFQKTLFLLPVPRLTDGTLEGTACENARLWAAAFRCAAGPVRPDVSLHKNRTAWSVLESGKPPAPVAELPHLALPALAAESQASVEFQPRAEAPCSSYIILQ